MSWWLWAAAHALPVCTDTVYTEIAPGSLDAALLLASPGDVLCLEGPLYQVNSRLLLDGITLRPLDPTARPVVTHALNTGLFQVTGSATLHQLDLDGAGQRPVLVSSGGTLVLDDVWLHDGRADKGGCIKVDGGALTMTGGQVHDCTSTNGRGGGIEVASGVVDLTAVSFQGNTVDNDRGGGGLYIENGSGSSVVACTFEGNTAHGSSKGGGGLYVRDADGLQVRDSVFRTNLAEGSEGGGAALIYGGNELLVQGCVFDDNESTHGSASGGAVHVRTHSDSLRRPRIESSIFCDNSAAAMGGALGTFQGNPVVHYSAFVSNIASVGGAVYAGDDDDDIELFHLTLLANDALTGQGEAIFSEHDHVELSHSLVAQHQGGPAVGADEPGDLVGSFNAYADNAVDLDAKNVLDSPVPLKGPYGVSVPALCLLDGLEPPSDSSLAGAGDAGDYIGAVEPRAVVVDSGPTADTGVSVEPDSGVTGHTGLLPGTLPTAHTGQPTVDPTGTEPTVPGGTSTVDDAPTPTPVAAGAAGKGCGCGHGTGPGAPWLLALALLARRRGRAGQSSSLSRAFFRAASSRPA
jgi:uncharacterized protein (TIGR03382 family)